MKIEKENYLNYAIIITLLVHSGKNDCWDWKMYWKFFEKRLSICSRRSNTISLFLSDLSKEMKVDTNRFNINGIRDLQKILIENNDDIDFLRFIQRENTSIILHLRLLLEQKSEKKIIEKKVPKQKRIVKGAEQQSLETDFSLFDKE